MLIATAYETSDITVGKEYPFMGYQNDQRFPSLITIDNNGNKVIKSCLGFDFIGKYKAKISMQDHSNANQIIKGEYYTLSPFNQERLRIKISPLYSFELSVLFFEADNIIRMYKLLELC